MAVKFPPELYVFAGTDGELIVEDEIDSIEPEVFEFAVYKFVKRGKRVTTIKFEEK